MQENNRVALLVNEYASDLKAGVKDIHDMYSVLTNPEIGACDKAKSDRLLNCDTEEKFISFLKKNLKDWHKNKNNQLIFYFTGHGETKRNKFRFKFGEDEYIFENFINNLLDKYEVKKAIIIVDACQSGTITGVKADSSKINLPETPDGVVIFASSKHFQESYEKTDGAYSIFSHLFFNALSTGVEESKNESPYILPSDIIDYINAKLELDEYKEYPQNPSFSIEGANKSIWIAKNIKYNGKSKEEVSGNFRAAIQSALPKPLTYDIPTLSQEKITGRKKELDDLHTRLFDKHQVVLMNGLGGIGKTTLAQVYISKYSDKYHHIAWITQLSENILQDFSNAQGLINNLNVDSELSEPKAIFNEICRLLNTIDKQPNLLVLDNADESLETIRHQLPKHPKWHLLITSRQQLNGFDRMELDFLSPQHALALFKTHYQHKNITDAQIKELLHTIDYHTLSIEILAKTAHKHRYTFEKLQNVFDEDTRANIKINRPGVDKIEKVTTFLCSIFKLGQLNENETWLLKQFVCLPFEFHGYNLLKELIAPENFEKGDIFAETLEELNQKGWLLKNQETDSYKMHRMIAEVVKKQQTIGIEQIKALVENISSKLYIDQTKDNPIDKFQWAAFGDAILHAFGYRHEKNNTEKLPECEELMELQDNLGWVYKEIGQYTRARKLSEASLKTSIKLNGKKHKTTSRLQSNLALVLKALGNYKGAKELLEKAMVSDEKNFGKEHPTTATRYSNLATVLKDLGDYSGALKLSNKSVEIFSKVLPPGHPNLKIVKGINESIKKDMK